nr:barstar family protein [Herbihabitans rhizosphaerae]
MPHVVDGADGKRAMLDAIAAALCFPDYFGHNLDALYDCLTDLSWLPPGEHVLVWADPDVLREVDPDAYAAINSVLEDAVGIRAGHAFTVVRAAG